MNNLYALFNQSAKFGAQGAGNGFMDRFNAFKKTINGNPRDIVQSMLQNGRISQAQYDQAVQMANQIMKSFK